jgi:hypothetical protein
MASEYTQGAARIRHPKNREVLAYIPSKDGTPKTIEELRSGLRDKEKRTLEALRSVGKNR